MAKRLARFFIALVGAGVGVGLAASINELLGSLIKDIDNWAFYASAVIIAYVVFGLVCGIIAFIYFSKITEAFASLAHKIQNKLSEIPASDVFLGIVGLILGLVIAFLVSTLVNTIGAVWVEIPINVAVYTVCAYLGWNITINKRNEINVPNWFKRTKGHKNAVTVARPKLLDTSVIIDGRILDICKTGIVEGEIIVPEFVLKELQNIADNADSTRRTRGRRGLDMLNMLMEELDGRVTIDKRDYPEMEEVDLKLLKLASSIGGVVVTNDYNLNKVALVREVPVLNINELANAVRSVVTNGQELEVLIVKEGKEHNQGVAYLDDGTMIVVDSGKPLVGETVVIVVTSVLQTSAGKMIFAKLKQSE